MSSEPRILGLDPARLTGWAHSDGTSGVWELSEVGDSSGARLASLREHIARVAADKGIDVLAFEDAGFGSNNRTINRATQALHNELRGTIKECAHGLGAEPLPVNPASLKKFATGNGRAKKWQMMAAYQRFFGTKPIDDNHADARFVLEFARQQIKLPAILKPAKKKRGPRAIASKRPLLEKL